MHAVLITICLRAATQYAHDRSAINIGALAETQRDVASLPRLNPFTTCALVEFVFLFLLAMESMSWYYTNTYIEDALVRVACTFDSLGFVGGALSRP